MTSVENFYWILYSNLLRPCNLDAWYYSPFGTQDTLVQYRFQPLVIKANQHVLFHFDQEPLFADNFGMPYEKETANHSAKVLRIFANSEKSQIKKKVCKDRGMLDWYFFYHGFAALHWFRDCQYVVDGESDFDHVFMCFNHLIQRKRSYRMTLLAKLIEKDLARYGSVSFHGSGQDCQDEIEDPVSLLSQCDKDLVARYLCHNDRLPLVADTPRVDASWSARLGFNEYKLWQNCFIHLVTETVFYDEKLHLTEKIFKPIVCQRPFMLVAAPNNLAYLRSYGFRTFGKWIDESYDQEQDPARRMDLIVDQIRRLCEFTPEQRRDMLADMSPVLEHNKRHFFGEFRSRIVSELVDNFDVCIKTWNNGRVDDRSVRPHPDLESVKQILLR